MCGIAGYLGFSGRPVPAGLLERMTRTLAHRGPDGEGFHLDGPLGLGHRRLAILDLTTAAAQPMAAAGGHVWLTYNGEIFNFREVRAELEARGHAFTTRSDSEVILAAYLEWGRDCLEQLNGMFAFALWDARSRELWLVRDRLGVKPLFYTVQPGFVAFASEIKGILPALPASPALDTAALYHFLSLNWTPAPHTFFRDVRQLLPAHHLVVGSDGRHRLARWWDVRPAPRPPDAEEALAALLADAVRLRLVSDVEVGAFLSSGLDSAAVLGWMRRHAGSVKTFTATFREGSYDESPGAAAIARALGTEHVEELVKSADLDALPDIIWHAEELTADSSMLAVYRLARRARRDVKVVLTGDGGDEVFGGYPTYLATQLARVYRHVPRLLRDRVVRPTVARLPVSDEKGSLESHLRRFVNADVADTARTHASWRAIFTEEEKRALLREPDGHPATASLYEPYLRRAPGTDTVNRLLYADLCFYLPNDMLTKVDRMTMAWGLEARTPYLDYRVVELAAGLSSWVKCAGGLRKKALLRRVARGVLPPAARPGPKAGFNIPIARWLRWERRDLVERHLLDARPAVLEVLSRAEIEAIAREHFAGAADHSHKLWGLLCLSVWWQRFMERAA